MSDVTQLLERIDGGDRHAAGELLPLVYDELRRLADLNPPQRRQKVATDATRRIC